MTAAVLLAVAGLASYGGFACLAMAMAEHWEQAGGVPGRHVQRRRTLRLAGTLLLCVAPLLCVWRDGPSFGVLLWLMLLSASGIAVAFTLSWRPGLLRWFTS